MSVFLLLSLTACGSTRTKAIPVAPPAVLMQDCPEVRTKLDTALDASQAELEGYQVTNADLVRKIRQLRLDLALCNADKAALRGWSAKMTP